MSGSDDVEVRLCDQKCINEFGRLNNRLVELRSESKQASSDLEKFDDAVTDLMMVVDGQIMLYMGETFVEVSEEVANEYCEEKVEKLKAQIEKFEAEEATIVARQKELKKGLYERFGNSINLESN